MKQLFFSTLRRTSCLAPALAFAAISSASASSLYVSKDGADELHCGLKPSAACLTIQYAIAQRAAPGDVIDIEPGSYKELITVSKNLTLRGPQWGEAAIDGMHNGTVVVIPSGITATLESLTIRNGQVTSNVPGFVAAGILNQGTLDLNGILVTGNSVTTSQESFTPLVGGVLNLGALHMKFSSIVSNSGNGGCETTGGMMNSSGTVTVDGSLIAENTVSFGQGCTGPGYFPDASGYFESHGTSVIGTTAFWRNSISNNGTLTLNRSTVSASDSDGILNAGALTIVNSTIAGSAGAGIANDTGEFNPTLDMSNATVAGNAADGIDFGAGLGSTVRNSILAGNTGPDCNGDFISGDYNLIQNFTECGSVEGGHDLTGVSAKLRNLGFYGGPTQTMDPMPSSPAIDGGNPAGCLDADGNPVRIDQRGFPRPSPRGGRCDIGAVEVQIFEGWF